MNTTQLPQNRLSVQWDEEKWRATWSSARREFDLARMEFCEQERRELADPFGYGGLGENPDPFRFYPSHSLLTESQSVRLGLGIPIGELITKNAQARNDMDRWTAQGKRAGQRLSDGCWLWSDGRLHVMPSPEHETVCTYQHPAFGLQTYYSNGKKWHLRKPVVQIARTLVPCPCCPPDPKEQGLVNCSIFAGVHSDPDRIATVEIYGKDVRIRRRRTKLTAPIGQSAPGRRGKITEFSKKSANRLLFAARNAEGLTHMVTLTYPSEFPCDGAKVKYHWKLIREFLQRRGLLGMMVLEFQKRGAPHFHVYTNGAVDKQELSAHWYKVVASGDEKHLRAGTKVELLREKHAIFMYCVKYVTKSEQKEVPPEYENVGRLWSLWGGLKVEAKEVLSAPVSVLAPILRLVRRYDVARRKSLDLPKKKIDRGGQGFSVWGAGSLLLQQVNRTVTAVIPETGELVKRQCQNQLQAIIAGSAKLLHWYSRQQIPARCMPCIA